MLLASRNSFIMMRFFQQQETMPPHLPWLINFHNFSWLGSMMSWVHPRLRGWWGNIWLVWPQHSQSPTTLAQVPAPGSDRTQWWRGPCEAGLNQQWSRDRWAWPGGRGAALQQTVYIWPVTNQSWVFHCIDQWESSITDLAPTWSWSLHRDQHREYPHTDRSWVSWHSWRPDGPIRDQYCL